jgi:hypothetical protein
MMKKNPFLIEGEEEAIAMVENELLKTRLETAETQVTNLQKAVKTLMADNQTLRRTAFRPNIPDKGRTTSHKNFNEFVKARADSCMAVLIKKDKEYSSGTDRLHNFKVAGRVLGMSPIDSLLGMFSKHLVSVLDICDLIKAGKYPPDKAVMDEKFGDCHNYIYLLEALIEEYRE